MNVKQYIADIEILEKERYAMEVTISQIDGKISSLGIENRIARRCGRINEADTHLSSFGILWIFPILWGLAGLYITLSLGWIDTLILFLFHIPSTVAIIWMIVATVKTKKEYEAEQEQISLQYKRDLEADRARVNREKQMALVYRTARNEMHATYCKTKDILDKMYGLDVIYGKYRYNIVAIAMFSEYFQSGRCNTLEGHEGAYNIYENEIRLGTIIGKLDEIIVRLDRIEQNQYRLFMAITEISKQQTRILSNLDAMAQKLDAQTNQLEYIAYNTNVARINSTISLAYQLY